MPPGITGSADSGSGARRVHRTKPSGWGEPAATPKLNGSPACQIFCCAVARRISAGAAISVAIPIPAFAMKRRRVDWDGVISDRVWRMRVSLGWTILVPPTMLNFERHYCDNDFKWLA